MPPFSSILSKLNPTMSLVEVIVYVVAGLGAILVAYAVFLKKEKLQDVLLLIGSACLIVYSLYIQNLIFLLAMSGLFLASMVEWLEILSGLHKDIGATEQKQTNNNQNIEK